MWRAVGISTLLSVSLPQAPTLEAVMARAGRYVLQFHRDFGVVVSEESYLQIQKGFAVSSSDLPGATVSSGERRRRTRAEFALVAVPGQEIWEWYRDVYEADGRPVHAQKDRLLRVLTDRPEAAAAEAQRMREASATYNLGSMRRNVNVPTFALMFLVPANQGGFEFRKKSEKKAGDVVAWVVGFTETRRPTLITTPDAWPLPTRGEIWIEPATGRVARTQLIVDSLDAFPDMKRRPERYSSFPRIQIDVTYALDPKLGTWVPVEMKEIYDRQFEVVTCTATYSNFRRVEVSGRLAVPKDRGPSGVSEPAR